MKYHLVLGLVVLLQLSGALGYTLRAKQDGDKVLQHKRATRDVENEIEVAEPAVENQKEPEVTITQAPEVVVKPEVIDESTYVVSDKVNNNVNLDVIGVQDISVVENLVVKNPEVVENLEVAENLEAGIIQENHEVVKDPEIVHNQVIVESVLVQDPDDDDDELTDDDIEEILTYIVSGLLNDEEFSKWLEDYYAENRVRKQRSVEKQIHRYRKSIPLIKTRLARHLARYIENEENAAIWSDADENDQHPGRHQYFAIDGHNIYGNSVGNDRVTNLYIFNYKDSGEEFFYEGQKEIVEDGHVGVEIDGVHDDNENVHKEIEIHNENIQKDVHHVDIQEAVDAQGVNKEEVHDKEVNEEEVIEEVHKDDIVNGEIDQEKVEVEVPEIHEEEKVQEVHEQKEHKKKKKH